MTATKSIPADQICQGITVVPPGKKEPVRVIDYFDNGVRSMSTDTARCCIHNVDETFADGESYKACGECWHVWQSEADFQADLDTLAFEMDMPRLSPDTVWCCPLCAHDF